MAIFGVQSPKFISSTGATVVLEHAIILKDEPVDGSQKIESPLDLQRFYIGRKQHHIFEVKINLWKNASPQLSFNEIVKWLYDEVILFKHKDGTSFRDADGAAVPFYFKYFKTAYETTTDYKDVLFLTFESTRPVDLIESTLPDGFDYVVDDDGNYIVDDDGNKLVGRPGRYLPPPGEE